MKNIVENQGIKTDKPLPMSYEALKAERDAQADRVNALAVENARCKFEVSRCHQTIDEMFKNRDKWIDKEWLAAIWSTSKRLMNETPATDAALAAIQAQGVEKFADFLDSPIDGQHCYQHEVGLARHFASTLREAK